MKITLNPTTKKIQSTRIVKYNRKLQGLQIKPLNTKGFEPFEEGNTPLIMVSCNFI